MKYFVYILHSVKLNRYYIGQTSNITKRMEFHRKSASYKFTGKADDWEIFLSFECESKQLSLKIESHIKRMKSKVYIENLKRYPEMIFKLKEKFNC